VGSSPSAGSKFKVKTIKKVGEILKRPTRADCKSADYVFAGSNPALPTRSFRYDYDIII
jgi:hypothetical protein